MLFAALLHARARRATIGMTVLVALLALVGVSVPAGAQALAGPEAHLVSFGTPTLAGISPVAGPMSGGTTVVITGEGLSGASEVLFGDTPATSFAADSDTQVTTVAPAGTYSSHVTVTTPGGTSPTTDSAVYTWASPATVGRLTKTSGPTAGGTFFVITGVGMHGAAGVLFGSEPAASFDVIDDSKISVSTPAHAAGTVPVTVIGPGGSSSSTDPASQFTFVPPPPTVGSASPTSGPTSGGTRVTISGSGLADATAVTSDDSPGTDFAVVSDTTIAVTTPAHLSGVVPVSIRHPGGDASALSFTYDQARPVVSGVSPGSGSVRGGTTVTISGRGFLGTTSVKFSSLQATSFTVNSDTQITAVTPERAAGLVNVYVRGPGGGNEATSAARFRFTRPVVQQVSPAAGPLAGGTPVTIRGQYLDAGSRVWFGAVESTSVTATQAGGGLIAVAPAAVQAAAGAVTVRVTDADGLAGSSEERLFTYQGDAPAVAGVSPVRGPVAGGTQVTITGTGFLGATSVRFSQTPAASYTVVSDTEIQAVTPSRDSGVANVYVRTVSGKNEPGETTRFTFSAPSVTKVTPRQGPVAGGTEVSLEGRDFDAATRVWFGGTEATQVVVDASGTKLTAVVPAAPGGAATNVPVRVATGGAQGVPTGTGPTFTYQAEPPIVSTLSPAGGPTVGGTIVTITGTGFTGASQVRFGGGAPATSFRVDSDTQITAVSPARGVGKVNVYVTTVSGISAAGAAAQFVYKAAAPPQVTGLSPDAGPAAGGSSTTLSGSGLQGTTAVTVGGVSVPFVQVSDSALTLGPLPAHSAGTADVVVTTAAGSSAVSQASTFTFHAPPTISSVNPSFVYLGTEFDTAEFTIYGTGFTEDTQVYVNSRLVSSYTASSTEVYVNTFSNAGGTFSVSVTTSWGTSEPGPSVTVQPYIPWDPCDFDPWGCGVGW